MSVCVRLTSLVINMLCLSQRDGEILCVRAIAGHAAEGTAVKGGVRIMMAMHHCLCVWVCALACGRMCV